MAQLKKQCKINREKPKPVYGKTKQKTDKEPAKSVSAKLPVSTSKTKKPAMKYTRPEISFKKSLESLNRLIDLIPDIFNNTDKEKAQDMSKTIVKNILTILKYIPEIKDVELLSTYKKTIKRITSFLYAINLKLESREFSPAEQSVTEDSIITDENKIQIVKSISPENYIRYMEKYHDGRSVVYTFLGKEKIEHWENNPDRDAGKSIRRIHNIKTYILITLIRNLTKQ